MPVSTSKKTTPRFATVADLLKRLGDIPAERVRLDPFPGMATERDRIAAERRDDRLYELIDGVLVEKATGSEESCWTALLCCYLYGHVLKHDLGMVMGPNGPVRLGRQQVRQPDLSFISWERNPRSNARGECLTVAPDLAVQVLKRTNTPGEMARRLDEYFRTGVRLVWLVDPRKREVRVYGSPTAPAVVLTAADVLEGGEVVPGFRLALGEWFAQAESRGPKGGR
ncbi:Uma2 family endonuclease [Paludisphaera rhizosphaerae]|uniref:Uma2 family endonuclease n=1 Tax=Paludisphaera rhizosphaerae TaxID=2711216 RepID=UPI0013EBB160|nr:Uma2 family endonuclease [Paludisphaera rhizosphaerae]